VRYADDCNVYVKSRRAGERILQGLRGCSAKLALKVNEAKTAVAAVWGCKFLGYCLYATSAGEVKRAVADQAVHKLRERIRGLTRRTRGRSLEQIAEDLRGYVPGWKAYFRQGKVMRGLDEWLRHRLRASPAMQDAGGATAPWA
jgi:RNA-directed DNA polymerase